MSVSPLEAVTEDTAVAVATHQPRRFDPESSQLIHVLTRCFIKGRDKAIDLLEAEKAQAETKTSP